MPIPEHLRAELLGSQGDTPPGAPAGQSCFNVGDTVKAGDRDNYGHVVAVNNGRISVHFVNPSTGAEKIKEFSHDQLTKVEMPSTRCSDTGRASAQDVLPVDWTAVTKIFPRTDYPWEVLPAPIVRSFKQLARACASSPNSLPGAACCILASTVGRLASVSPKKSWEEPPIIWHGHISPSGTGKTPAPREMANVLHELQAREHKRWAQEIEEFRKLSKKEQRGTAPPIKERGYFATNLTLEGIRDDLDGTLPGAWW